MHHFYELAYRCTYFSLNAINEADERTVDELSETGSTPPVKNLQALNLQKMIHAVGLFSIFEAHLQRRLGAKNGYREAELILEQAGQLALFAFQPIALLSCFEILSYRWCKWLTRARRDV